MTPLGPVDLIVTVTVIVVCLVVIAGVMRWAFRQLTGR